MRKRIRHICAGDILPISLRTNLCSKQSKSYEEAIRLDPDYALPHVGIADFYIWSVIFGEIPSKEGFPKAKAAIENALKIDNLLGEAFALLSFITLLYDWDWAEAERLVKRALELNPNYYFAHEAYSAFLVSQGLFNEGREEIVRAEELDPLSPAREIDDELDVLPNTRIFESPRKSTAGERDAAGFRARFSASRQRAFAERKNKRSRRSFTEKYFILGRIGNAALFALLCFGRRRAN